MVYRCACGRESTIEELLDAARGFDPSLGIIMGPCAGCTAGFTARPRADGLSVGHTYFGGAMHFEATEELSRRGLRVEAPNPDELVVALGARTWRYASEATIEWMAVLPGSASEGKILTALRLDELGVWVQAFERPLFHQAPFDGTTVLQLGDRILVVGQHSARRRAWARLHEGR